MLSPSWQMRMWRQQIETSAKNTIWGYMGMIEDAILMCLSLFIKCLSWVSTCIYLYLLVSACICPYLLVYTCISLYLFVSIVYIYRYLSIHLSILVYAIHQCLPTCTYKYVRIYNHDEPCRLYIYYNNKYLHVYILSSSHTVCRPALMRACFEKSNTGIHPSTHPSVAHACVTQTWCLVWSLAWGATNTSLSGCCRQVWPFDSHRHFIASSSAIHVRQVQHERKEHVPNKTQECYWSIRMPLGPSLLKFCRPGRGEWQSEESLHLAFGADVERVYCGVCARRLDGPSADVVFSCFLCM